MHILMVDPRIIALIHEIRNHPKLFARMQQAELEGKNAHATIFTMDKEADIPIINSFEEGVAFLATEAGVLIHGTYSHDDFCDLCDVIREKLVEKRTVILNAGESAVRTESRIIMQSDYKH